MRSVAEAQPEAAVCAKKGVTDDLVAYARRPAITQEVRVAGVQGIMAVKYEQTSSPKNQVNHSFELLEASMGGGGAGTQTLCIKSLQPAFQLLCHAIWKQNNCRFTTNTAPRSYGPAYQEEEHATFWDGPSKARHTSNGTNNTDDVNGPISSN
jgi:hypothetical protein